MEIDKGIKQYIMIIVNQRVINIREIVRIVSRTENGVKNEMIEKKYFVGDRTMSQQSDRVYINVKESQ